MKNFIKRFIGFISGSVVGFSVAIILIFLLFSVQESMFGDREDYVNYDSDVAHFTPNITRLDLERDYGMYGENDIFEANNASGRFINYKMKFNKDGYLREIVKHHVDLNIFTKDSFGVTRVTTTKYYDGWIEIDKFIPDAE